MELKIKKVRNGYVVYTDDNKNLGKQKEEGSIFGLNDVVLFEHIFKMLEFDADGDYSSFSSIAVDGTFVDRRISIFGDAMEYYKQKVNEEINILVEIRDRKIDELNRMKDSNA